MYQPQVKSSGFRKGKAPASLVIQMVGKGKLFDEALEVILPVAYTELVEAKKLNPIGLPAIKLLESAEEKDWKLEVQIAERPELKLGEYKKIISDAKKDLEKDKESKQKT
jgi:trigger factor